MENTSQIMLKQVKDYGHIINYKASESPRPSLQKKQSREKVLKDIWLLMEKRWILKDETPEYFLLTRRNVSLNGHMIIAVLLGWWLFFIPNLVYHLAMNERKKIFKQIHQL